MPGYFPPGTPLYTDDGGDVLKGPPEVDAAKRLLAESGYAGEPVTLMAASIVTATPMLAQAASRHNVQNDARGSVASYGTTEGGPYTPDMPTPAHGLNHDFQDGSRG